MIADITVQTNLNNVQVALDLGGYLNIITAPTGYGKSTLEKRLNEFCAANGIVYKKLSFLDLSKPDSAALQLNPTKKTKIEISEESYLNLFCETINTMLFRDGTTKLVVQNGEYVIYQNDIPIDLRYLTIGHTLPYSFWANLFEEVWNNAHEVVTVEYPEIASHVCEQKMFLKFLTNFAETMDVKFVVITHSPQIIDNQWDLVIDLFPLA